jgi:translation initiation factor 2B subunit (eIF-2B alpha/beta/delta family)
MSSATITTLVKMAESLPDSAQELLVEHAREFITTLQDESRWSAQFEKSQAGLIAAARRAKREIAEGRATDLDHRKL